MTIYGCHALRRGDRDAGAGDAPRWGGVANAPAATAGCPPPADADPAHVRRLQEDLRALGFRLVGNPDGDFGRMTELAVRELQIYAKMEHVARVRADAPAALRRGAHLAAQEGQEGRLSAYVASLEQVENDARYPGPVSGVVNAATRDAIEHWLANGWRCPVIVEAWNVAAGDRADLFRDDGEWAVNLWYHDDVRSGGPRMYARDFTEHYDFPQGRDRDEMVVLGDYVHFLQWSGPRSVPSRHTWPEGELLPAPLVGVRDADLAGAQRSTFRVVRAVSEVECLGFFDSVNSYDNAFVSVGPCHWTLGIVSSQGDFSEGELCGFLAYLRHADAAAFEQTMGFFGVRVDEDWARGGRPDGSALFVAAGRKYVGWVALEQEDGTFRRLAETEVDGNYFKTWHWFYRFVMAGRTVAGYRRRMWDMARIRLRDLRDVPWGDGVAAIGAVARPATIGDVFTSERAMAILLRWHIRFPGHVVQGGRAGTRIARALADARAAASDLAWDGDPSLWTSAHERALVEGLRKAIKRLGNQGLKQTIAEVDGWPGWLAAGSPRGYVLAAPVASTLREDRGSFELDTAGLPPAP